MCILRLSDKILTRIATNFSNLKVRTNRQDLCPHYRETGASSREDQGQRHRNLPLPITLGCVTRVPLHV